MRGTARTPLTHIGRVCLVETDVDGHTVPPEGRISLCWASANRDETVFEEPDRIRIDRMPNPHVGFGSGHHGCLGAPHARLLLRTLIAVLGERVAGVEVTDTIRHAEQEAAYTRYVGFDRLRGRLRPRD